MNEVKNEVMNSTLTDTLEEHRLFHKYAIRSCIKACREVVLADPEDQGHAAEEIITYLQDVRYCDYWAERVEWIILLFEDDFQMDVHLKDCISKMHEVIYGAGFENAYYESDLDTEIANLKEELKKALRSIDEKSQVIQALIEANKERRTIGWL